MSGYLDYWCARVGWHEYGCLPDAREPSIADLCEEVRRRLAVKVAAGDDAWAGDEWQECIGEWGRDGPGAFLERAMHYDRM